MNLCWADRAGIAVTLAIVCALLLLSAVAGGDPSSVGISDFWLPILSKTALPIWILLRLIDFAAGGPWHRAGYIKAKFLR